MRRSGQRLLREQMVVARAERVGDPADVEYLRYGTQRILRVGGNRRVPPPLRQAAATTRSARFVVALRGQRRREIDTDRRTCATPAASLVSIEWQQYSRVWSPSGMLEICERGFCAARRSVAFGLRACGTPPSAGTDRAPRHVAPGQRDAVAAVHGAQESGRIGVEEVPVRIRRHPGHAPHDHGRCQPILRRPRRECVSRVRKRRNGAFGHSRAPAKKLHSKSRQACSTSCGSMPRLDPARGLPPISLQRGLVRGLRVRRRRGGPCGQVQKPGRT